MILKYLIWKLGFLLVLIQLTTLAKPKKKKKDFCSVPGSSTNNNLACVEVKCKKKAVIIDFDVTSGLLVDYDYDNPSCSETNIKCTGESHDLLTNTNLCYMQQKCFLPFPQSRIVVASMNNPTNASCFHQEADFIKVTRPARCAKQKEVKDICDTAGKKGLPKKQGIVKSHEDYPWLYDNRLSKNDTSPCSLRYTDIQGYLVVEVKVWDICESDTLTLSSESGSFNINETVVVDSNKGDTYLDINFTVANETNGCEGFVICYKEVKTANNVKKLKSLCDKVTKTAKIVEKGKHVKKCKCPYKPKYCCCAPEESEDCKQRIAELKKIDTKCKNKKRPNKNKTPKPPSP